MLKREINKMIQLYNGECLEIMSGLPESSVDLILTDPPYGTTRNKWDVIVPFDEMWRVIERILKPNGVVVMTSAQPFTSKLIISKLEWFKYDMIWKKTIGSGQLNINKMPLRLHEEILVFSPVKNGKYTYNEQLSEGTPYSINRKGYTKACYSTQKDNSTINKGTRRAKSVLEISNPRIKGGHPTQKPVSMMEQLVKTYSNENDVVLDCFMGSGTTGVACLQTGRDFIGIELDDTYFELASDRLNREATQ